MNFKPLFKKKIAHDPNNDPIREYMVPLNQMVTLRPDQGIMEAVATILEKRISGAPVLDEQRRLVGNLSEKDCLRIVEDKVHHKLPVKDKKVADYMSTKVFTFSPTTSVVDACMEFLNSPIRRYAVVENGALIGEISRRDILRMASKMKASTW